MEAYRLQPGEQGILVGGANSYANKKGGEIPALLAD
jgi:hypothetical protein